MSTCKFSADALEKQIFSDLHIFFVAGLLETGGGGRSHCESAPRISAAIAFAAVPVTLGAVRSIWLARRTVDSSIPMILH